MKRGNVYYADLTPILWPIDQEKKLIVVVSPDISNNSSEVVTVVPLALNNKKLYQFEVALANNKNEKLKPLKAQCDKVKTISKIRLGELVEGNLTNEEMRLVDSALKLCSPMIMGNEGNLFARLLILAFFLIACYLGGWIS